LRRRDVIPGDLFLGIRVDVRFRTPRFIGVPFVVAGSDMIACGASNRRAALGGVRERQTATTALPHITYGFYLHGHPRFHHELANRWIRGAMSERVKGPMQREPFPNTKRMRSPGAR